MKFHEFGNKDLPHVILIHGGGQAWWDYLRQARMLSPHYHVILPTLDGHGEEHMTEYISTEESARKIITYINENCGGSVFAIGGVSLGGQIVIEILSQSPDIAQKAIIDGSICYPQPRLAKCCSAFVRCCWPLMFSKAASKMEVAILNKCMPKMRLPKEIVDYYMRDMPHFRKETMCTIYRTYMAQYRLDNRIKNVTAEVMYWYGSKEMKCVKNQLRFSNRLFHPVKYMKQRDMDMGIWPSICQMNG